MWGQDLTLVPGFEQAAAENLRHIRTEGARAAFAAIPGHPRSAKGGGGPICRNASASTRPTTPSRCAPSAGTRLSLEGRAVQMREDIHAGTQLAPPSIAAGENIIKYGYPSASPLDIPPGAGAHPQCALNLSGEVEYLCAGRASSLSPCRPKHSRVTAGRTGA